MLLESKYGAMAEFSASYETLKERNDLRHFATEKTTVNFIIYRVN